jgi:ATP-binding cassette subfamily C protein
VNAKPENPSLLFTLRLCLDLVSRSTLWQAAGVAALVLTGIALETLGIGLIFPFIKLVLEPASVHEMPWVTAIYGPIAQGAERESLIALALGLLAVFVVKNLLLVVVYYTQARFVATNEALLARRLLRHYLTGPYVLHLDRNSAELIRNVFSAVTTVFNAVFMGFLTLATELCLMLAIAAILIFVEPMLTLAAIGGLALAIGLFYRLVRRRFTVWGAAQLRVGAEMLQTLQEGFHSVKEVKVLGIAPHVVDAFFRPRRELSRIQTNHITMTSIPRLWVEIVTVTAIVAVIVVVLSRAGDIAGVLATLSLFAAAVMRLMPSMNRILIAMTGIRNGQEAVGAVHRDIAAFAPDEAEAAQDGPALPFAREIRLEQVAFRYPGAHAPSLENVELAIRRGESIGLAGPSGAGKTTLVDLILGLLVPSAGRVTVDGAPIAGAERAWRRQIGYVPQSIYLTDDTIRRNVAFGLPDASIDDARVWHALELAQLGEFVRGLPAGLDSAVGERGVGLSGGERQRIGIARALYRDPAVLVLDEATASLDSETEHEINRAIEALSGEKTLIVIAHRLSTIRRCDRVIYLQDGRVVDTGTFGELNAANEGFRRMVELSAL